MKQKREQTEVEQTRAWTALITQAVTEPGVLGTAYKMFYRYSAYNVFWALGQAMAREIPIGPIATFRRWKDLGRSVRKGQSAVWMTRPAQRMAPDPTNPDKKIPVGQYFYARPFWFFLSQTDGDPLPESDGPPMAWEKDRALAALEVVEEPFGHLDGNCGGYAKHGERVIAVNPVHPHPARIYFHELAHVVLGHTEVAGATAQDRPPATVRELEAELTAYICAQTLGLEGAEQSRGYVQAWWKERTVPEASCKAVCIAAAKILKAGLPASPDAK